MHWRTSDAESSYRLRLTVRRREPDVRRGAARHALSDSAYVDMMIVHHGDGITMAELAAKKASNQQVRQLATRIVTAQQAEMKGTARLAREGAGGIGRGPLLDDEENAHGSP
jgi:uncharacterized protein (DUF305 family)